MPTIPEVLRVALLGILVCGCARASNAPSGSARSPEVATRTDAAYENPSQDSRTPSTSERPRCADPAAPLTPFERACFEGALDRAQASLAGHTPNDQVDDACRPTPLMLALSPYIAEPNAKASAEEARAERKATIARLLLDGGASVRAADTNAMTILHYAVVAYFPERVASALVKRILVEGADTDARTTGGQTPLLMAVSRRRPLIVRALLEGGANPSLAASTGETPAALAEKLGDNESGRLIRNWRAASPKADAAM